MSDIGTSALQGQEFVRGLTAEQRKTASYNALAATYGAGPAVDANGNPDAIKAQEYGQRQLTNPVALQQAQSTLKQTDLENTGKAQDQAYNALANPVRLVGLQDTNANTEATTANTLATTKRTNALLPGELTQQGATLAETHAQTGNLSATTAKTRQDTAFAGSDREQQAALGMANQLLQVRNTGGDVQAAFDQMAPRIAQMPGVNPDHITGLRSKIAAPGFLENLAGQLGNTTIAQKGMVKLPYSDGTGYALVPSASVPKAAPGIQSFVDRKTGQVGQRTVTQAQSQQAINIAKTDLGQMDLAYDRTDAAIDKAISKVGMSNTGYGAETLGRLPGSTTKDLQGQVDTLKANIAPLAANATRQGGKGAAAIPVRNMAEFKAYQDSLGAVNLLASADVVRQQLQTVKTNLQHAREAAHAGFAAKYGDAVLPADKAPAPAGNAGGWSIKQVP